jgi:hypothetical protein
MGHCVKQGNKTLVSRIFEFNENFVKSVAVIRKNGIQQRKQSQPAFLVPRLLADSQL